MATFGDVEAAAAAAEARLLAEAKNYDPLKRDTLVNSDPFHGAYSQTNRMRAYCEVFVDGIDITHKLDPHLISVRVQDGAKFACELEIDDRDGRLPIPPITASIEVRLGWARESMFKMFTGIVEDVEHGFGRKQGGRRMWIHGTNPSVQTRLKQPMDNNMGAGVPPGQRQGTQISLPEWVKKIVSNAGGTAYINPFFEKFKQDHWGMTGASPIHEITTLAAKFGAMVQWKAGNKLDFLLPGEKGLTCRAVWRDNLIGWRIKPWIARAAWKGPQAQFFDAKKGEWIRSIVDAATGMVGPGALAGALGGAANPAASRTDASQQNEGAKNGSSPGSGRIVINGEPAAQFGGYVSLEGARPGVDGHYLIVVAEHIYSRQGYVTWLDVETRKDGGPSGSNPFDAWPLPRPNPNQG